MLRRNRNHEEVLNYLATHSVHGAIKKPISGIARDLGMSQPTVQRALKSLEARGLIRMIKADKAYEPNTIVYQGNDLCIEEEMTYGTDAIEMLRAATVKLEEYVRFMDRKVALLRQQLEVFDDWKSRITSTMPIPGTGDQMVIVKSSTPVMAIDDGKQVMQFQD
ncbi:helix-turn-helix domain-containing protein [Alicyclobacillus dauci]|uniref:MarR family transcriptional regulator n=1 Tax=Alicyclobacillus dauci TaxID=1475485 RepID=A0ABY6Z243_9BACL|nr:helix-turn-helix domain-containing protein [Alicyclobacillus dauci]WAH36972.1 MarR family transcriptional regulator [Alicyclobacillus dauci]